MGIIVVEKILAAVYMNGSNAIWGKGVCSDKGTIEVFFSKNALKCDGSIMLLGFFTTTDSRTC